MSVGNSFLQCPVFRVLFLFCGGDLLYIGGKMYETFKVLSDIIRLEKDEFS